MKKVIVIHELDHAFDERSVIGVATSLENAASIIDNYYGKDNYKEISYRDISDGMLEYSIVIEVGYSKMGTGVFTLTLEWFVIND